MEESTNGKKVLVVLEAGNAYPSGYLRGLIYKDYFERTGFQVEYINRLDPKLIKLAHYPPRLLTPLFALGLRKVMTSIILALGVVKERVIARKARNCDVVYMSKVTSLRLVNKLRRTKAKLVLDFGDAVWLPGRAGEKFNGVLRNVDAVTTDNEMTAQYARKVNPNCTVIPDSPQVEWFDRHRPVETRPGATKKDSTVILGWVGSPGTAYNLFVVWEALERLFSKYPNLHLRLLGTGPNRDLLPPFERVTYSNRESYSQSDMIDEVLQMDIGLFPLQDVESSRVRGVLKATVYMAGKAVVVCSPVGQCVDLIQDGVNGMLAASPDEWEQKIEQLILNPDLRDKIAEAALETIRHDFTVAAAFNKLRAVLNGTNGGKQVQ
jgi:glycosyltransferase involved in cell wall biosynthesis